MPNQLGVLDSRGYARAGEGRKFSVSTNGRFGRLPAQGIPRHGGGSDAVGHIEVRSKVTGISIDFFKFFTTTGNWRIYFPRNTLESI